MTYANFAASIGVPDGTVKRWAGEGMPTMRMGPRAFVDEKLARRWVAEHRPNAGNRSGVVYFARGRDGLIKIGFSSDVGRRMLELGAEVLATVPGSVGVEFALHDAFADDLVGDEWFRPSATLLAFIGLLSDEAAA